MNATSCHRPRLVCLLLAVLAALGPAPAPDTEALLRQGNEAFRRGDFAAAAALYEQAEPRAADPALVAFDLAAAKYQLALADGDPQLLREAERLYRSCLGSDEPLPGERRARALFGLGNCLLQRAGGPDDLRVALECYRRCLRDPGCDEALAADLRHNVQRARLLLAQGLPPEDKPSGEDKENNPPPEKQPAEPHKGPGGEPGDPDDRSGGARLKAHPGDQLTPTEAAPSPGAGDLQPVPDRAEPVALTPEDAALHLRQAARRIQDERQAYRQGKRRPAAPATRDW
jgi:tetratricopeptide (TPR) repeat protein